MLEGVKVDYSKQSVPPRKERRGEQDDADQQLSFNPRSRVRSDLYHHRVIEYRLDFQSTLPRKERRKYIIRLLLQQPLSIHAPA